MKKIFTLIMTLLLICSSSWAGTFTIRVNKDAACTMDLSNGLYLWWWETGLEGQVATMTLDSDGWYTTTITTTATSINCLVVNTDVVNNGWGGHQQTIDYTDITGDICLEIGAPDEYYYYDIYETSCEEEFIPASSYHDFSNETNNAQWHFAQDGQANYWTIGWGADVINPTLYITMDGDTYDYLEGTSSTSWAYIPVTLTETDQISFNWQGAGELNYDYLSVYLCPVDWHPTSGSTTIPSDAIRLAHNLCEASQWQEEVCTPNVSGAYYLCFMWSNDASVGNGTPIMIDNVRYGTPEVSTVPTAEDLAEYEQDGYFVACINFQGEVCNDIVFAGSYNSWDTYPENMVHFTPLEDFDGWYVAVIPVTVNEEGVEVNDGKPAQLANDGSFSWDYQTGDVNSWELISGSVDITAGYSGESDLKYWSSAEPVILKSLYFKNHNSPCHVVSHEYTVNLIAPSCGGYEPAIIGSFNGWSEGVAMWLQSDGSYSYIFTDNEGGSFKFKATTDTDWSNQIQLPYVSDDGSIVWVDNSNIVLDEQTTITIDYSNGKYTLCEDVLPPIGGITYELNGGVTNDDNWLGKGDMWTAFCADAGITLGTLDEVKANANPLSAICTPLGTSQCQAILDNAKWDWLEKYIMDVQNPQVGETVGAGTVPALTEGAAGATWRYALAAFFVETQHTSWPYSADFSQAGQDAAYIPTWKHAFANPTEPTGEWVLNAPYKEGYTFDGWYATADFSGEKVTTVNAETTGTLYAKWVEYIPTIAEVWAMEDGVETKISGVVNWVRGTDVFIQDATGGFHLSCSGTKPEVGTKIVAKGTRGSLYGKPTLSGAVIESAESAEFATPIVSTLAELLADPLKYFGQRVSVLGVYVAEYDSYGNIYVADIDGANKVQGYYMMPDQSTFPVGTKVSITAVASLHWGTFEFVGDVAGIEKVSAAKKDQYEYPARYDGKYTLTNNWVISNIEGNFADNMPGSEGYVRGMAAKDGKMYFINRETQSIVVVDGETGEMLASIKITGEHLFEKENEDGTWSSAVTFPFNDIKFDQEGHCLVGALITSPNEHFMIYVVDIETGEADLLFSERLADNPDYADISCRFDAFGVAGDITTDGVIMAADATYGNWLVYRWLIVDGVVQEGEQIDCSIDIDSDHTLFWNQSGFYTASHIFPLDEKGERFYVDGYNTLPMLFDENGRLIDDFINCPYGTSVNNAEGEILNMNTGHNGLVEFQVGNEYFLLMAAGYTSSSVPSSFALYKFADADHAFSGMEPLWYLPANGMGNAGNGCRTAPVAVEVVGNKAYLYLYVNNNGYARYEFTVEGAEVVQTKGKHIWPILLDDTTVENNASKIISDLRSNDYDNFLYNWDMTYTLNDAPISTNFHGNMDGYLSLLVGDLGWAGCGISLGANSASAAESLRQAIVDNPENYYLHLAIKSTDNYSHCFYIFGLEATKFVLGPNSVYDGPVYSDFSRNGEWVEFDIPMSTFAEALSTTTCSANMNIFVALTEGVAGAQLNLDAVYFYNIEDIPEKSYTIRVKKDDVSDMDISNGLYLWWWKDNLGGQLANMTLGDDGWYTTTITSTASSINCLAVNTDVVNNAWIGQQTIDYTNITGDVCLAIGAKDWIYNYNYNLYEIPCSPMEYTTEHDFEDTEANAQWRFVQNGQTNYWTIGSAAGSMDSGSNALYITSDGNNYTYNNNASSTSWAYIPVTVTAIDSITFYWKGEGESYCDDLQVYLFPKGCTPIAGSTYIPNSAIQLGEYLSGQTDWQYFSAIAGVDGEYNLCLTWYNDGSIGEMPIAVDNMAITTPLNTTEYPLTYVLDEDGTATVAKCATDYSGNVSIPTVVTYNGTTYTVTSISENAFKECGYLTSVTIPNSVTSIGRMAFAYCRSLESVTLSENISSIEGYTFYDCNSLTSITIPNNVTYVGENAFEYGYNLSAVTFGNNVTTIDNYAFAYCRSLESVTIPASVSYIGYSTFVSCNSLNSIVVESGNTTYDSRNNCNAIIETASNTLITGCQSTIIPETVTTIGDKAFYGCDGLTTIVIPNSVTSIGYSAFAYCDNLSSVDLGDGITTIHGSAFEYCYAMTSVTIPASVTEIGSWAFYYCPTIVMEGTTPPTISSSTFKSEATIFVPCTALDTYLATSVWQDLNLQGSNYTVTLSATEGGSAQITASDCATNTVTIEAYPEERYVFTQWSDGNTDNPRILTLTEDIALTAEFTILTYPVTNLVVTTNCGKAYASWEGDAPYYELTMYSIDGTVVLYDLVPNHYKDGVSNSNPYEEGDYYCQVRPMYSNSEGDYAGEAVQAPFTISADNCVDLEIHDLIYTITDETTVNLTWNSEAYVYHVQLYDYQNNLIADEYINTNSYSYTLPEMGRYSFYILGYNEDQTQFSSWQNISFDIVYSNWEYDLNFTNGYVLGYGANNKEIHLFSQDGNTHLRLDLYSDYDNSILGTYIVQASYNPGDCSIEYSNISYNGITSDSFVSGVVTVMRDNEDNYVFSFDITDGTGKTYANICTISSELLTSYNNEDFSGIGVTALTAAEALSLTQNLPDYNLTTMPYMVNGVISRITSYDVNLYSLARFYISEDGSTTNEFYCYNTSWLNNTSFTTGDEIAEGDTVVIYGNLQNYQGNTPEIKGYVYQHFAKEEEDESCYTLTVDATEGGYVSISPEADCYEEGTEVTLTAIANEGYQFSQWNDGSTENPRTLMMNSNTTLTAEFSRLTYVITNLVVTTNCGTASASWESDAPYYEVLVFNTNGEVVASGIIDFKENVSNTYAFAAGDYIWQVRPMYSSTEGDYAGDAVQLTFTINLDGCIDPEIYDLTYTTTNDSIVNVTWVSEAPLFQVWMYDSFGELLNSEFLNGNNYCDTLSETGVYQFQIRSVDADTMYYTSPAYYLDINITIPETPCYTLAVNANDGGNVSVSPLAECYEAGTQVVITATPNENYEFVTWSDGNTSAQRTIVMDKNYSLTATFRSTTIPANNYTLTLTYDEGGTVGRAPEQDYYEENATVLIFANANEGYKFVRWSDGNTENVRSITITQDTVLHATFVEEQKEQFTLTLTAGEGGTVTKTPDQPSYEDGTSVVIAAIANDGYEFVTWSDGNISAQRTIIMDRNYSFTAIFQSTSVPADYYTLILTCDEGGTVRKSPDQEYYEVNTVVTIFAQVNEGYDFVQWSDGNTDSLRTITMTQNIALHAIFVEEQKEQFTLTLTAGEGGTVTKTPDQPSYAAGSVVTITAQANEGFEFVSWSDGDKNSVRHITMTQNVELHATFKRIASNYDITNLSVTSSNKRITAKWESIATRFEVVITDRNNEVEHSEKVDITDDSKVYKYTAKKLGTYTVTIKPLNASDQQIGIEDSKTVTLVMKYSLFISTENENAGTVNEEVNGDYVDGETVEIVATPKNGYRFKMWDDGDTNAKRTLVMNQDYYLTASFSRIPTYTLTISEGENGLASMAAGSYTYKENEEVTITPLPYDGYVFDHWVVNGIENTTETLTLVMTQDYSVYPVCVSKPIPTYTLTILPGEYGKANMEAGTYTYQEGEEVTLLPIADTDYLFDQWVVNDEVKTDSVLVLVMDKDYTVMPTFIPNQVGVENIYDGITILVEQWTITVEATQAQDIALYDLVGHLIEQQPHTRIASFTVPSAGLYLIRTSSGVKKVRVE